MVTAIDGGKPAVLMPLSGAELMELRRGVDITLEELAAEMGLSFGYLGRLEHEAEPLSDNKRFSYLAALHRLAQQKVKASKNALTTVEATAARYLGR